MVSLAAPAELSDLAAFEQAKRIVVDAIEACVAERIDPALVAAALIGAGVSWYSRHRGAQAAAEVLGETLRDIAAGRARAPATEH